MRWITLWALVVEWSIASDKVKVIICILKLLTLVAHVISTVTFITSIRRILALGSTLALLRQRNYTEIYNHCDFYIEILILICKKFANLINSWFDPARILAEVNYLSSFAGSKDLYFSESKRLGRVARFPPSPGETKACWLLGLQCSWPGA